MNPGLLSNFRLTPKTAALVAGISTLGVYLTLGNSKAPLSLITLIAVVTGFYVLGLLLLATLPISRFRVRKEYSLLILVICLIAVGASRGWLMFELISLLIPSFQDSLFVRMINSSLTVLIWGLIFAQVEARLEVFQETYRRKFSERATDLASRSKSSPAELAGTIDSLASIKSLQSNLTQISQTTEGRGLGHSQLIAAAQQIRDTIETSLRPLSHRIWFESSEAQPKFKLIELLKESLINLRISWYPTSLIISLCFFVGALSIYDLSPLVARILAFGLTLAILLRMLERYVQKSPGTPARGIAILLVISFLSNLAGEVASSLPFFGRIVSNEPLLSVAGLISTAGILWVESVFSQLRRDWDKINAAIDESGSNSDAAVLQSRFAGYLHNNLQSQLSGIALALERVGATDEEQINQLLHKLRALSSRSIGQDFIAGDIDPVATIHQIAQSWRGIADVSFSIQDDLHAEPQLELVAELIQEAVSNAVRHSGASSIDISVSRVPSGLKIVISHPSTKQKSGKGNLGQMWLERFSQNHSVILGPDGIRRLTVVL